MEHKESPVTITKDEHGELTVTITKAEYKELRASAAMLNALEACGVDNWEGFDDAQESLEE